jgi:hypothetical protein
VFDPPLRVVRPLPAQGVRRGSPEDLDDDPMTADHELLIVTCAPYLGWWAECECGWISNGRRTEEAATRAHGWHRDRVLGVHA